LDGVQYLTKLESLSLDENNIASLDKIKGLERLTYLSCLYNPLTSLVGLEKLTNLEEVNFGSTNISCLKPLKKLTKLCKLYCWETSISDIGIMAGLPNLREISCARSDVTDLSCITKLKKLKWVYIEDCRIKEIPSSILDLGVKVSLNTFTPDDEDNEGVFLKGNPIFSPPREIIAKGNDVMQHYYSSLKGSTGKLNEAKLVLVGEGAAGKTSLIKRFIDNEFNPEQDKTDGIAIHPWDVLIDEEEVKIHCWDFGGQEIMRATHQLFLSERCVYIVVLDSRKDENPEHWLKQVMAISSNSPIFMISNKIDEHLDNNLTQRYLKEKYPNIVGFYKVSCKNNVGIDQLKKDIINQVAELDMRNFVLASNWLEVKQELEVLKETSDHISYQKFEDLCCKHGITEYVIQDILLTLLNDLGQVIHFKELEELQTQVLNPSWITEGIYALINSDKLAEQNGVLTKNQAERILSNKLEKNRYKGKGSYLMQVMEQFELCYKIPSTKNINPRYLIPDLLPTELQATPKLDRGIEFIYQYQGYMPPELMARFIVKSH